MNDSIKITAIIFICILTRHSYASDVDWNKWLEDKNQRLENAMLLPEQERFHALGRLVGAIGHDPNYPPPSGVRLEFLRKAQAALIAIPGHAEYYNRRVYEAYTIFRDPTSPRRGGSANRLFTEMMYAARTLRNLPSPETIRVLGDMLADEWEYPPPSSLPNPQLEIPPSLAVFAVRNICLTGLRDAPTPPFHAYAAKDNLRAWQQWYAKVKTGELAFSFLGQNVEYRFKPDGTWETTPISVVDDPAPEFSETLEIPEEEKTTPMEAEAEEQPKQKPFWPWLAGLGVLLISISAWLGLREKRGKAVD